MAFCQIVWDLCSLLTREHGHLLEYGLVVTRYPYSNRLTNNKSSPSECGLGVTPYLHSYGLANIIRNASGYGLVVTRYLYPSAIAIIIVALWIRPFNGGCLDCPLTGTATRKDYAIHCSISFAVRACAWVNGLTLVHLRNRLRARCSVRVFPVIGKTIACLACGLLSLLVFTRLCA